MRREERTKSYKKGIDSLESRRRRDDTRVQLRKNKREEGLAKRRAMGVAPSEVTPESTESNPATAVAENGASKEGGKRIFSSADIPGLFPGLSSPDDDTVLKSMEGFRRMLTVDESPPVEEVISSGALPHFVRLLSRHDKPRIQFEAAWALTNIASTDHTQSVVDHGALPYLVSLVGTSPEGDVREQSAWCLGNIAGDSPDLRDSCLQAGALQPILMNIAQPATQSLLNNVVWALSNLCRGKPQPNLQLLAPALPYLANLVNSEHKENLQDALWALSYVSDGEDDRIQAVLDAGIIPKLVDLLSHTSANVITPTLRTLGNIVSGSDTQTQAVLDAGVLNKVQTLLSHARKNVRKETCWLLSNIAAGTKSQIGELVSQTAIMSSAVRASETEVWEVRKEAMWILSNVATGGTDANIELLVELGGIGAVCGALDVADAKIISIALEAIENILQAGDRLGRNYQCFVDEADGLDKIEGMQHHQNNDIYKKAVDIIENHFGADEVEDENLAPATNENGTFSFGLQTKSGVAEDEDFPQQPLQPFNFSEATSNFDFSS
mmetsp:Transcript_60707/g.180001  ORF Transcript_60707/g.180001 Transcript_60707/m.180001 type:complete len:553 (-) Transcript_60707:202-1860(-)